MALRSGAGGQPVPPLIDFKNCCQLLAAPPRRLGPRVRKRCPGLCKLLHPHPTSLSSKINNKNLSMDFEHGRLSSGVWGPPWGSASACSFPGRDTPAPPPPQGQPGPPVPGPQATATRERSLGGTMAAASRARRSPVLGKGLS